MGQVIHADFAQEREWQATHERLITGLLAVGTFVGDDAALMKAKADCTLRILRSIVEGTPAVHSEIPLPANLSAEQIDQVNRVIRDATLQGVEAAMTHSVEVILGSIYDLCTSWLGQYPSAGR